mmetsp:Transcript_60454/g.124346  ORF Transcript_60454/g.124346 Transcript_60454/m.124346 type:complete len:231 (-) Transcript_60454:890-1582(-)
MMYPSTNSQKYMGSSPDMFLNLLQNSSGSSTSPTYRSTISSLSTSFSNRNPHPLPSYQCASVGTLNPRCTTLLEHTPFSHSISAPRFLKHDAVPSPSHNSAGGSILLSRLLTSAFMTFSLTNSNLGRPGRAPSRLHPRGGNTFTLAFLSRASRDLFRELLPEPPLSEPCRPPDAHPVSCTPPPLTEHPRTHISPSDPPQAVAAPEPAPRTTSTCATLLASQCTPRTAAPP